MGYEAAAEILTALMVGCTVHFNTTPTCSDAALSFEAEGVLWRDARGRFRLRTDWVLPGSSADGSGNLETLDDAAMCSFLTALLAEPSISIGVGDSSDTRLLRAVDGQMSRRLADLERAALRVDLHSAANTWIYRKPDVWRVLILAKPLGSLRSRLLRCYTGVRLPAFYASLTSNPMPPPERLPLLLATVDRLAAAASEPVDSFIARLVQSRIRQISDQVVYVDAEQRFYIEDLEPTPDGLAECRVIARTIQVTARTMRQLLRVDRPCRVHRVADRWCGPACVPSVLTIHPRRSRLGRLRRQLLITTCAPPTRHRSRQP